MKTAVIGVGVIGNVHLGILLDMGITPVAICDVDENATAKYPQLKAYTDYKEMLDKEKPDIVHVCTPHYLHAEMAIYALERDINVLCEKPLCMNREEIDAILQAEENSKAQLAVCFQNRYTPRNICVKEYLKGKTVTNGFATVFWQRGEDYYNSAAWRGTKKYEGGGVLINQAIHTIDLLNEFCGGFEELTATCSNLSLQGVIEVEDTASICLYNKTAKGTVFATNASAIGQPIEIMLVTSDGDIIEIYGDDLKINKEKKEFANNFYGKVCYGMGHAPLIADFYDCVATGRKFPIDGKEGQKALRIVLSAYESESKRIKIK
jgi:predicted dehydrogenase